MKTPIRVTRTDSDTFGDCIDIATLQRVLGDLLEVIDTFEGDEVQMPYTTARLLAAKVLDAKAVLRGEA